MQSPAMKRFTATLVGVACSLGAVALWIVLGMFGFVAGYVGALMGLLFIFPYKRMNKEDRSLYPYIFAAVLIFVEIVGAEMLSILLLSVYSGLNFAAAFMYELENYIFAFDIGMGLLFSYLSFAIFVPMFRRRDKWQQAMENNPQINNMYNAPNANPYNDGFANSGNGTQNDDTDPFGGDPFGSDPFDFGDNKNNDNR